MLVEGHMQSENHLNLIGQLRDNMKQPAAILVLPVL
jgi:hypothetical protein